MSSALMNPIRWKRYEQALVSLVIKETIDAEGWCTKAVVIEGG